MALNLFEVLPTTFIQESLETREQYENLYALYELDNEVRLALLDLIRLNKLKLFHGIVYSFGINQFGELGIGNRKYRKRPTSIDYSMITDIEGEKKRVIQVSAGGFHSLILCEAGIVYSFGYNRFGQLGNGTSSHTDVVLLPTPIDTSKMLDVEHKVKRVIQVAVGDGHSLILCEDGSVYSFGWNTFGQLGTGNTNNEVIPTEINTSNMDGKRVIQVSAGGEHSLLLCEDGMVYVFGDNKYGQLGTGNTNNVWIPTPIDESNIGSKRVIQVSAGGGHSLILCEDGTVYAFGQGEYGELGTGNRNNIAIPTLIDVSNIKKKKVLQVSAGDFYSLMLCEDGTVYSFGSGLFGQIGSGNKTTNLKPTLINIGKKSAIQVSAGKLHSLILCEDGSVYFFGSSSDESNDQHHKKIPTLIDTSLMRAKRVIQVSAGRYHSLLLT